MNEVGTDQPQDHFVEDGSTIDPALWQAQPDFPQETPQTITLEVPGKCVGRDKKPVPAHDVWRLASIGMKDIEIADWFGIDSNTLRYNFSVELLKGRETLKQSLRRKQIEVAMSGNPTMLIFLGKNLLGQSDAPTQAQDAKILPWSDDH